MAITTGAAADTGVLSLDVGSRPRASNPGDGDTFASTLDTQMQKPRTEQPQGAPRAERQPKAQPAATKEEKEQEPQAREDSAPEAKPAEKRKAGADKETAKPETEPGQNLVALLLQVRVREGEKKVPVSANTLSDEAGKEGGKDLPQAAASDPAAAVLAAVAATTGNANKGSVAEAVVTTPGARAVDPRLATATPAADLPGMELPEPGREVKEGATVVTSRAGDATREQTLESPLQAARSDTTGAATTPTSPKGEKGDNFAATLAALRDAVPRSGADATVPANTATATASSVAANGAQPAANTNTAAPSLPAVNVPVGQQGWDQVVGERVLWMTRHGMQEAKIELNPRDLGPIEVRVSVQQDQASVAFTTHNPAARDALEAAMPRLRDMLADSGLNLAQSDVSHRSPQQQAESGWGNGSRQGSDNLLGTTVEEQPTAAVETSLPSLGAVDYYA